jgi:hypothetical protein
MIVKTSGSASECRTASLADDEVYLSRISPCVNNTLCWSVDILARVLAFSITSKSYQIAEASTDGRPTISVGLLATKEQPGHTPEQLTPIEEAEALPLAQDGCVLVVPVEI